MKDPVITIVFSYSLVEIIILNHMRPVLLPTFPHWSPLFPTSCFVVGWWCVFRWFFLVGLGVLVDEFACLVVSRLRREFWALHGRSCSLTDELVFACWDDGYLCPDAESAGLEFMLEREVCPFLDRGVVVAHYLQFVFRRCNVGFLPVVPFVFVDGAVGV